MKPAALLMAIQTLSLDYLEMFQVVINDKVSSLQTDERTTTKSKEQAAKVGQEFLQHFPALKMVGPGRPRKDSGVPWREVMSFILGNPGSSKGQVIKAIPMSDGQWTAAINQLKKADKVVKTGDRGDSVYYATEKATLKVA